MSCDAALWCRGHAQREWLCAMWRIMKAFVVIEVNVQCFLKDD